MAADRTLRILSLLGSNTGRLCEVATDVTNVSGAGVMILADERPQASICTTDAVSALIEELQYTLGEGPCVDAHRFGHPITEPEFAVTGPSRWAGFSPPAVDAGVRAVFGFPIRIGTVRLGALNLYRNHAGPLSDDEFADALVMADVVARAVLVAQAGAPPGQLGQDLDGTTDQWLIVHQAAGMVSIQLDVSVEEALVRLRAYAFRHAQRVTEVAAGVVEHRIQLDREL